MKESFPQVKAASTVRDISGTISYGEVHFREEILEMKILLAKPSTSMSEMIFDSKLPNNQNSSDQSCVRFEV